MKFNLLRKRQCVLIMLPLLLFYSCNSTKIPQPQKQNTDGFCKYQYYEDTAMWEHVFKKSEAYLIPQGTAPKAIIIPHHDITQDRQNSFYKALAKEIQPSVIVVISPDHFEKGQNIITLPKDTVFKAPDGDMQVDEELVLKIAQSEQLKDAVSLQSDLWAGEHGIYIHTPFLKHYFEQAKFVPVLSKMLTTENEFEYFNKLGQLLNEILPPDALVIASVDFSHYQVPLVTMFHDRVSQNTIQNMEDPRYAEIDSPETIQAVMSYARAKNAENPILIDRSFTYDYIPQENVESTSHQYWCFYDKTLDEQSEKAFYKKVIETKQRYNSQKGERNQTVLIAGSGTTNAGIRKTWTWDRYNTSTDPAEILLRKVAGKEARFLYGFDAVIFDPEPGSTYTRTLHGTALTVETIDIQDLDKKYQEAAKKFKETYFNDFILVHLNKFFSDNPEVKILEVVTNQDADPADLNTIKCVLVDYDILVLRDPQGLLDAKAYMLNSDGDLEDYNLGIVRGQGSIKGSLLAVDFFPDGISIAAFEYESEDGVVPGIWQFWEEE